jgi:hypothetical protein
VKKDAFRHPKLLTLADMLGVSKHTAIGILEMLWDFTAALAPGGDIGRYTNQQIADGIEWKGNSNDLITALIDCGGRGHSGWIDRCTKNRLVIHDWKEHCPSYISKRVARKDLQFVQTCLDMSRQSCQSSLVYPSQDKSVEGCADAPKTQEQIPSAALMYRAMQKGESIDDPAKFVRPDATK